MSPLGNIGDAGSERGQRRRCRSGGAATRKAERPVRGEEGAESARRITGCLPVPASCSVCRNTKLWRSVMARVCQVTGKGPMVGNNVSHANNKTKRRWLPNLQYRRFWVESENRWVRLRITNAALRLIDKVGIDQVVADLSAKGEL